MTNTPRRCSECGSPLPPVTGRGRPRMTCTDEDSPDGRCTRRRRTRREEARVAHQYAGALYFPGDIPGMARLVDVYTDGDADRSVAEVLADAGFRIEERDRETYLAERRLWLDLRAAERKGPPMPGPRRAACYRSCPIFALPTRPEVIARAVARRRARAAANPVRTSDE